MSSDLDVLFAESLMLTSVFSEMLILWPELDSAATVKDEGSQKCLGKRIFLMLALKTSAL